MLDGLFHIVETLFGVRIRPDQAEVWHDGVRFFRIERPGVAGVRGGTVRHRSTSAKAHPATNGRHRRAHRLVAEP